MCESGCLCEGEEGRVRGSEGEGKGGLEGKREG